MIPFFLILIFTGVGFWLFKSVRHEYKVNQLLTQEFPISWREVLNKKVGFYHTLNADEKDKFEKLIHRFLVEIPVVGVKTTVSETIAVLVAASASIPVFSFKNWSYNKLKQVLIVDNKITLSSDKVATGVVYDYGTHHIMHLSKQALLQGFQTMNDRKNVGIHEFAHILDALDGRIDGIPESFLDEEYIDQWKKIIEIESEKIKNKKSRIDKYAITNSAEFFAVTSEYFFENPIFLQKEHPKLYEFLTKIYEQDPIHTYQINFREILLPSKGISRNDLCPCQSGKKFKHCCLKNQAVNYK